LRINLLFSTGRSLKQTIIWQLTSKLTFIFSMFTSSSLSSTQESSTMPHTCTSLTLFYSTENVLKFEKKVLWYCLAFQFAKFTKCIKRFFVVCENLM
jgi:hypothetical protein